MKGQTKVGANVEVEMDGPVSARLNGNWNFGQVVTRRGLDLALEKAEKSGIGLITAYRTRHVGRLGQYTSMAARRGSSES